MKTHPKTKHRPIFCTYSVPDLQLNDFVVDAEAVGAKFHANCHLVLLLELVVHHTLHQA